MTLFETLALIAAWCGVPFTAGSLVYSSPASVNQCRDDLTLCLDSAGVEKVPDKYRSAVMKCAKTVRLH